MVKPILTAVAAAFFLLACEEKSQDGSDSVARTVDTVHKKGISVTDPVEKQPHVVSEPTYNGPFEERYDNGVIFKRGEVQGGLRAGEWLTFYEDGKLWSKGTYIDGLRQGYGVSYWKNGQKSSEGYYKDDVMVGKWTFWDELGNKVEKDFGGDAPAK